MLPFQPLLSSHRPQLRFRQPARYFTHSSNTRYVKIKRPWARKFLTTCFVYVAAAHIWSELILYPAGITLDDEDSRGGPTQKRTLEDEATKHQSPDAVFIPVGWPRLEQGKVYQKSDVEYQEFLEFAQNEVRVKALPDELASIVLSRASQSLLTRELGAPLTKYNSWFMYDANLDRAPDTYYRSGIEFSESGISWVQKPMSVIGSETLRRSIVPIYVALGVKDACAAFLKGFWGRFWDGSPIGGQELGVPNPSSKASLQLGYKKLDRLGNELQQDAQPPQFPAPQGGSTRTGSDAQGRHSIISTILRWLPLPSFGPGTEFHAASLAFRKQITKGRMIQKPPRQRGTIYLRGPMGISGPRGYCRVEVEGQYHLSSSQWVSLYVHVRELRRTRPKTTVSGK
ncbi:hypothetical protein BJY04DRAFT_196611 [Aspergillus karnatakaensis]|uniref:uncharacterized protein n=1 Tax=Aspergillus karnatakaensis TaxID=1810916 RepID=UPI003CCD744C